MQTKIITDVRLAAIEISFGKVVALPTETVYGLGADAMDEKAVLKIYETKDRPHFNPLIVHILSENEAKNYAEYIPEKAYKLMAKFSPGPLTYILKKSKRGGKTIPDIVTSGIDSIALRIPSHPIFRELLKITGLPICAPSANRSGRISPVTAEDVLKELDGKIRYILDGDKSTIGIESTIISFLDHKPVIVRPGSITKEQISETLGEVIEYASDHTSSQQADPLAPGMLKHHYAPTKKLYLITEEMSELIKEKEIPKIKEMLNTDGNSKPGYFSFLKYENLNAAAINLFSDLREMDESECDHIIAAKVKNEGIGFAINDRLTRAAHAYLKKENGKWKVISK